MIVGLWRLFWIAIVELAIGFAIAIAILVHGHHTGRWLLFLAAILVMIMLRGFRVAVWLDVVATSLVMISVWAALEAPNDVPKPDPPVARVQFRVPAALLELQTQLPTKRGAAAVFVLLTPQLKRGGVKAYLPHRYEVVMLDRVPPKARLMDARVKVERGKDDATASRFAADLATATKIVMLPPPSKSK